MNLETQAKDGEGADTLLAQLDLMRKALEPFAKSYRLASIYDDPATLTRHNLSTFTTPADFRRASEAIAASPPPADWVLVPREPDEAMKLAGARAPGEPYNDLLGDARNIWSAMLSASPLVGGSGSAIARADMTPPSGASDSPCKSEGGAADVG